MTFQNHKDNRDQQVLDLSKLRSNSNNDQITSSFYKNGLYKSSLFQKTKKIKDNIDGIRNTQLQNSKLQDSQKNIPRNNITTKQNCVQTQTKQQKKLYLPDNTQKPIQLELLDMMLFDYLQQ